MEWHYFPPEGIPERDGTYLGLFRNIDYPAFKMRFELMDYYDGRYHCRDDEEAPNIGTWRLVAWTELKVEEVITDEHILNDCSCDSPSE